MKRLYAILFSLLLVWMQAVVAAQVPATGGVTCNCSGCGAKCCCVTPSTPDSQPAPATPIRTATQNELSIFPFTSVTWFLPAIEAQILSPVSSSPLTTAGVQLFTRHCALLI